MSNARFTSDFTDAQLLDAAIRVIESMSDEGIRRSQRHFDAYRAQAGFERLPRADSICSRLGLSWEKLCAMPSQSANGRAISFGKRDSRDSDLSWITEEQLRFALRLAARRQGSSTITSADYRRVRDVLMGEGCDKFILPDENQILQKAGNWGSALAIAGLQPNDAQGRELQREAGVSAVLDRALEMHGMIPTQNELLKFVAANELALPDRIKPYPAIVEQWRSDRLSNGIETPTYEPRRSARPDFGRRVIWEGGQRIRRGYWTEELAVEAMRRFLSSRRSGEPTTRKAYVDWSKGNREAPAASYLDEWLGGFSRIRRLANERRS